MTLYSQTDVNRIFEHIPPSTMKYWWARGLFDCAATKEVRSRTLKKYGLINLYQIGLVSMLMAWGIPMTVVRDIVMALDMEKMVGGLIVSREMVPGESSPAYDWLFYDPQQDLEIPNLAPTMLFCYLNLLKASVDRQINGRPPEQEPQNEEE